MSADYLARIHTLPCIIHLRCYGQRIAADEAHHLEFVRGAHSDYATVPLCRGCHIEMHQRRRRAFYRAHKINDVKLLAWTVRELLR